MSMNIKDPEAHRLAREMARLTGKSMTHVVRESLEQHYEVLARERRRADVTELLGIARRVAERADGAVPDHGELLYDDKGLPK